MYTLFCYSSEKAEGKEMILPITKLKIHLLCGLMNYHECEFFLMIWFLMCAHIFFSSHDKNKRSFYPTLIYNSHSAIQMLVLAVYNSTESCVCVDNEHMTVTLGIITSIYGDDLPCIFNFLLNSFFF